MDEGTNVVCFCHRESGLGGEEGGRGGARRFLSGGRNDFLLRGLPPPSRLLSSEWPC